MEELAMNAKAEIDHLRAVRDAMHGPFRCDDPRCCVKVCPDCDEVVELRPNIERGDWRCVECSYTTSEPAPKDEDEVRYWSARR